jgi:hypothetical protein
MKSAGRHNVTPTAFQPMSYPAMHLVRSVQNCLDQLLTGPRQHLFSLTSSLHTNATPSIIDDTGHELIIYI